MGTAMLFGIPVQAVTMSEVLQQVATSIESRSSLDIGVVNAAKIVNMRKDPELSEAVLSSDAIFADGMSVVWASRFLGKPLPERIAGIDLMHAILDRGQVNGYRVFCLGATQEVLDTVCDRFAEQYPGTIVVGSHHGYFNEDEERAVAERIRDANADVLFVAITSPKKERFMAKWSELMKVPVVHGVGGSFDVVAGKVERAPEAWQRMGLEWLYRVKQEPRRLWKRYLVTNVSFAGLLLRYKLGGQQ
jgi:N-acetylglucosaminyldiphosphoundecaprenol N-acetyl-beta-D-mannosaminyltransferase